MIILKPPIFYPDFAGLEATWVDRTIAPDVEVAEVPATFDEEGVELTPYIPAHTVDGAVTDVRIKCHSYGPTQMQMFRDDAAELGTSVAEYEGLIAQVESAISLPAAQSPEQILAQAKAARQLAVDSIVVTVSSGKRFDGDEVSQDRMGRAITVSEITGLTECEWVLADNKPTVITVDDLKEALVMSFQAMGAVWSAPYR